MILISPALETDLAEIQRLASSFDLDCEDIGWKQFQVCRSNNKIIGFGRLRQHPDCTEVATIGVDKEERGKGIGSAVVKELIRIGPPEIYLTCVIPDFFSRFGFIPVKQYPPVLRKKVDFCKLYHFTEEQIFVMKLIK